MYRKYCRVTIKNVLISVILTCSFVTVNVESENITTTGAGDSDEVTDLPDSVVEAALYQDYGKFTTIKFHYYNHQYDGNRDYDYCYDDYSRCLVTLVVPTPICAYDWYWYTTTKDNYCDVYFENCLVQNRKWRLLSYGRCTADQLVHAVDTFRRFLFGLYNETDIVQK